MTQPAARRDPVEDLRRIAFLLERTLESSYRVKAFRTAAAALAALPAEDVVLLASTGGLRGIKGIGDRTAAIVEQSVAGEEPDYLASLEAASGGPLSKTIRFSCLRRDSSRAIRSSRIRMPAAVSSSRSSEVRPSGPSVHSTRSELHWRVRRARRAVPGPREWRAIGLPATSQPSQKTQ